MDLGTIDSLDAAATLALAEELVLERRRAELADLRVVSHWAALHSTDPRGGRDSRRVWCGEDRLVDVGGEGTPRVRELCLAELAIVREVHVLSLRATMADVLDLQHRLPTCWRLVEELQVDAWVARRVAVRTRALPRDAMPLVDAAVADVLATESPSRVFDVVDAKVIEADPQAHSDRVAEQKHRRFAGLTRSDGLGHRCLVARMSLGDAARLDAMVDRVADLLTTQHPEAGKDERRSIALGWLARPLDVLRLLLENGEDLGDDDRELLATLQAMDGPTRDRLRPRAVLHVHLHQAALEGPAGATARCEGLEPLLAKQVADLLGHDRVTVLPVLDLNDRVAVTSYEHPEFLKDRVWLTSPGDRFPHATGGRRHSVDFDHPTEFRARGPAGQTGTHNSQPLSRRSHRTKTHLPYKCRQLGPGEYVWRTPHGHYRLVDHRGTHHLPEDLGSGLLSDDALDYSLSRLMLDHHLDRLPARHRPEAQPA
ncbi:hypothetical protein ACFP3Q_03230 [Nocardioides sp. GCM10027113]|uniref:hypothetical protein n=1 Tax=unclassified Nocardioides TaxID=2615069 RepID=UPI00360F9E7A